MCPYQWIFTLLFSLIAKFPHVVFYSPLLPLRHLLNRTFSGVRAWASPYLWFAFELSCGRHWTINPNENTFLHRFSFDFHKLRFYSIFRLKIYFKTFFGHRIFRLERTDRWTQSWILLRQKWKPKLLNVFFFCFFSIFTKTFNTSFFSSLFFFLSAIFFSFRYTYGRSSSTGTPKKRGEEMTTETEGRNKWLSLTHSLAMLFWMCVAKSTLTINDGEIFSISRKTFSVVRQRRFTPKIFSCFLLLSPALCHHDFFSNHVLTTKSNCLPLNSIRFAKLQLFSNI